jgi:DTW domain-containing protein YfiP
MHHKEAMITSNTARLAKLTFSQLQIHLRGVPDRPIDWDSVLSEGGQPLYLYPEEDSLSIDQVHDFFPQAKSFNLIVPDGSWRQTKKYRKREIPLQAVPTVKLPIQLKGNYQLRKARFENHLSTFEAIAYALDYLEARNISTEVMGNFNLFVERHLNHRHPKKVLASLSK